MLPESNSNNNTRICRYCNKKFYSCSNRCRHERTQHKKNAKESGNNVADFDNFDSDISDQENDDSNNRKKGGKIKSASDGSADKEDEKMDSTEDDNDDDTTSSETGSSWFYWSKIIMQAIDEIGNDELVDVEKILKDPFFNNFLEKLYEILSKNMEFARYMKENDKMYRQIKQTSKIYIKELNFKPREAFEKAWNERQFLIKQYIRDHLEDIQDEISNKSETEEEEMDTGPNDGDLKSNDEEEDTIDSKDDENDAKNGGGANNNDDDDDDDNDDDEDMAEDDAVQDKIDGDESPSNLQQNVLRKISRSFIEASMKSGLPSN